MMKFLLWLILLFLCWPLALLALVLYPLVWLLLLPFRLLGIAVEGVFELLRSIILLPSRSPAGPLGRLSGGAPVARGWSILQVVNRRPAMSTPLPREFGVASVEEIRSHFPALERRHGTATVAYFDGPGGTQVPRSVASAMADYLLHHNANAHWAFPTSIETDAALWTAREVVADFLAAAPSEIVFGANMTTLTFHIARALGRGWSSGDEVVVTDLDHHANVDPWRAVAAERDIVVRSAPFDTETGELDLQALESIIGPRTRLLAIGGASNALGTINDVPRAAALARRAGALVFVDAVHSAPHMLVDVGALGCDLLACSAYKFYGPHVGILWARQGVLEALDVPKLEPAPNEAPYRVETGTQNHEGIVGTGTAVEFMASLADGPDRRVRPHASSPCSTSEGRRFSNGCGPGLETSPGCAASGRPRGAPHTDAVLCRGGPERGGRRAGARGARGLRVARGLLRDDRGPSPRPRRERTGAGRLRVLHHRERDRPPRRGGRGPHQPGRKRMRGRWTVGACALAIAGGVGEAQETATPHEMHQRHRDPQAMMAALEDPARDGYQKPEEVVKALALREGEAVADIGSGTGYFSVRFAQAVGDSGTVYAVDVSADMIRHLNRRLRDARDRQRRDGPRRARRPPPAGTHRSTAS